MSTNKIIWESSIIELSPTKKVSQSLLKIKEAGYQQIKDLLWIIPLRSSEIPDLHNFSQLEENTLFLGEAEVINTKLTPAFGRKGKNKVQLFNVQVVVKDKYSDQYLNLRWFNAYPNIKNQLTSLEHFKFLGTPTKFKGVLSIVNPTINPKIVSEKEKIIQYPTINGVSSTHIKKIIDRIPLTLWNEEESEVITELINKKLPKPLLQYFKNIHGVDNTIKDKESLESLIYSEFFINQLKVLARKSRNKKLKTHKLSFSEEDIEHFKSSFSYNLTTDQEYVLKTIQSDFSSGTPMMRMIQGDVGCGKTTIAIIATLMIISNQAQVAIMCPTEALARQHHKTISKLIGNNVKVELVLGSTKDKKVIYQQLEGGSIDLIIGTHSLIQKNVIFRKLQLAIIDEQHKFGVKQRQSLFEKGKSVHGLIMTATPIPRSLQLAQYGDLDISTIRTMPSGRKGTQTRIVKNDTYKKYLTFINTRIQLGEQVYVVVPAIEESETLAIENTDHLYKEYIKIFPKLRIQVLHGQLKPEEKSRIMEQFEAGFIDILISTSVIEVGINVLNATVMSIYNPDRFGLSSLHQLRGRVGRGSKPGFCFLVTTPQTSEESLTRLKIIEKTSDGFVISEEDLKNRGQGNLFGNIQSGHKSNYKIANIIEHYKIFEKATKDIEEIKSSHTELLNQVLISLLDDKNITSTI